MYAAPSFPMKHRSQRVRSAILFAGAGLLALSPSARAEEPEQFVLTQQTHVLARAHANNSQDMVEQGDQMATASAHGDEQSQCSAGDDNVSAATAQARVMRDFASPSRQGYTLTALATAGGGHWVRCGSCTFGICIGRFPYDTAADSTASSELAIDVHFPPDARPIPYKVFVRVDPVQLAGIRPVIQLLSADGRSLLDATDPTKTVKVEGGPGRDLRFTVSLAAGANHNGVADRVVTGGTVRVVLSLERAPLIEAAIDNPINNGTETHGDFLPVGALLWDEHPLCTGTLIGPRTVLTAAHCVYSNGDPTRMVFVQGDKSTSATTRTEVTESFYPKIDSDGFGYDDSTLTNDLAIVHLKVSRTPAYDLADPGQHPELPSIQNLVDAQTPLTFVGFGNKLSVQGDEVATGIKRQIPFPVALVDPDKFFYVNHQGTTCHGDSGGPALLLDHNVLYIFGIASGGQKNCAGYGSLTRIDNSTYIKWIKPLIQ